MKIIKYLIIMLLTLFTYIINVNAEINLTVSPIKYEIETNT